LALQLIENTYFFSEDSFTKLEQKYKSLKQEIPTFFEIKKSEIFERIARLALRYTTEK
jgi:DNA-directed RNA polymerase delta subunit